MAHRENMSQEEIERTFTPTGHSCPECGELLYADTIKDTLVCLECNHEAPAPVMVCQECRHIFPHTDAIWAECPGGGTVAVCPKCESSDIS